MTEHLLIETEIESNSWYYSVEKLILPFARPNPMTTGKKILLEVCANGIESALIAQQTGVNRIELCEHLEVGGLTPGYKIIEQAMSLLRFPVHVLVRPQAENFFYSTEEFEIMKRDVKFCKSQKVQGIVFGILKEDGTIDLKRCEELLEMTKPLFATFHRAFDVVKNPLESLEEIIALGFDRILTSGQKSTCLEGSEMIAQLVKQARGRISILAGGGITEDNIAEVVKRTRTNEFHFSAKVKSPDENFVSDLNLIRKIKEIAEKTFYE